MIYLHRQVTLKSQKVAQLVAPCPPGQAQLEVPKITQLLNTGNWETMRNQFFVYMK